MEKSWNLLLQLNIEKQAKGKSSYVTDAILLPTINCDITTNTTVDLSFIHKSGESIL